MKIFNLVFLLVGGILSITSAQQIQSGGNPLGDMDAYVDGFKQIFKPLCDQNAEPSAFKAVELSALDLKNSITSLVEKMTVEFASSYQNTQNIDSVAKLYCDEIPNMKNCVKRLTDSIKLCYSAKNERDNIERIYNFASRALQFACDNSKNIEKLIFSPDAQKCLNSSTDAVTKCATNSFGSNNATIRNNNNNDYLRQGFNQAAGFKASDEQCKNIDEFEKCSVKVLRGCQDKTASELFNNLYESINNEIPCENLSKSKASPAVVANFLLIIAAMMFSL